MTTDRRAIVTAALAGAAFAFVVIAIAARFDVERATFGDGVLHRYVAEHLGASPEEVTADLEGHGTALRYGRIVLPLLIWLLSAGQPEAMPYVQPLLMILAAAAIAAAARVLVPSLGRAAGLAPFVAVGLIAALAGGFAEPVAVAFALWAVIAARNDRWIAAAALFALAMLTRENAAGVAVGVAIWTMLRHRIRGAAVICLGFAPVAIWHAIVGARFGFLPLMDPLLRTTTGAFGPPVVAAWRSVTRTSQPATTIVVVHLLLAALALLLWRRSDLGVVAAACGLQTLWNGPPQWRYVGDGIRLQVFLEVFVVLALLASRTRDEPGRSALHPLPEHRRKELVDGHVVVGQDL